ncbi:MAG: hypothetical protein AAB446_02810 [Patescibacteria group bacterium]
MNTSNKKGDFNRNHPERQSDEVFITNADNVDQSDSMIGGPRDFLFITGSSWDNVGWKTKRKGKVAYDIEGKPLGNRWPGAFPVFAKQEEINKKDPEITKRLLPSK